MNAAEQWAAELAGWRIDEAILAAAPQSPYEIPPELFADRHADASAVLETPTLRRARQRLPAGGTVLDVGCGPGGASLPLAPPAGRVYGVDSQPSMLEAFRRAGIERGVQVEAVAGRWPDVAGSVPVVDVVVCANVAYNVAELPAFIRELSAHARERVVLELSAVHPWVPIGPLWRAVHGQDRPSGPSAELAVRVVQEAGYAVQVERWDRSQRDISRELLVAFTRRRLCLPADRDPEVDRLLGEQPGLHVGAMATLWWDPADPPVRR